MRVTVSCNQEKFTMMRTALGIWILSAVVCVGRSHHHVEHDRDKVTVTDHATIFSSVPLVASANKEFTYSLYRKLNAHPDSKGKNIFFSPRSVSLALAALSVGARGKTHQQLFSGLGFNSSELTQANVDEAFHALMVWANMSHQDTSEGTAMFVDHGFTPNLDFLDVLKKSYSAEGFSVNFTNTVESTNTINRYVAEKTNGKIEKLVDSMDEGMVMYLLSYIYFKGKWVTPFDPTRTKKDEFTVDENTKVPVEMMNMEEDVDLYYDQRLNTSVLHLPFNSSSSMLLLLPDDMATLENSISPGHVTKWMKWMKSRRCDIYVPKFSIKTSYKLKDVLIEMGMTDMFSHRADLSGIAEGPKLVVSEVVHKATLDVDEAGATATAATGIGIMLMSFRSSTVLKFNRPFMVLVIDRVTEETLFVGKIINPNI